MNTIRLTYSPHGFGKVLKVTAPQSITDENTDDSESMDFEPKVAEQSRSRRFNPEDDEL